MNHTDSPSKQATPFGINGQREPLLPTTPAGDNTASYDMGFPPVTMTLKSAGGLPPKGQNMNQILYELSSLCRWFSAGAINTFDSSFSSSIGGYPKGTMLISDDLGKIYISTNDGNGNNPNETTDGWSDLLSYLGLAAGAPPIGIPFFWPSASMPNIVMPEWSGMVFLKLNGSTFSASTYPKLALVWPGLRLTESRGEFIRTWDDGRGVDNGRSLLSAQLDALQDMTGSIEVSDNTGIVGGIRASSGVFTMVNNTGNVPVWSSSAIPGVRYSTANFSAGNVARTAQETRSRNIAFNFLVRAK